MVRAEVLELETVMSPEVLMPEAVSELEPLTLTDAAVRLPLILMFAVPESCTGPLMVNPEGITDVPELILAIEVPEKLGKVRAAPPSRL